MTPRFVSPFAVSIQYFDQAVSYRPVFGKSSAWLLQPRTRRRRRPPRRRILRKAVVNYEAVRDVLVNHHQHSDTPPTVRDVREMIGGAGNLSTISNIMKDFYNTNFTLCINNRIKSDKKVNSDMPVKPEYLQDTISRIASLVGNAIQNATQEATASLTEQLAQSGADLAAANSKIAEQEETIAALKDQLAASQEAGRVLQAGNVVLEKTRDR